MILQSPHNPSYLWLRPYIEATLIPRKVERGDSSMTSWTSDDISYLFFEPFVRSDPIVHLGVRGRSLNYVSLNHLSLGRLMAIASFMRNREQTSNQREPLVKVRNRKIWMNHLVFHLYQPYALAHPARIIGHAVDRYCQHLGDCWLIQFKRGQGWGSTFYVEASEVFSMSLPRWQNNLEPSQTEQSIKQ